MKDDIVEVADKRNKSMHKKSATGGLIRKQTIEEETVNSFTHFFGTVVSIIGCYLLVQHGNGSFFVSNGVKNENIVFGEFSECLKHSLRLESPDYNIVDQSYGIFLSIQEYRVSTASYLIFTSGMVFTFLISTLYHGIQIPKIKRNLQKIDHSAVSILIAGTYTPFCLIAVKGTLGWIYFAAEWFLAVSGSYLFFVQNRLFLRFETYMYLTMGWLALLAAPSVYAALTKDAFWWLLGGGIVYTIGVVSYSLDRIKWAHSVWHLFAMGGSFCHWVSILRIR